MTDPTTWPTVAEQRPPLGAKCNYFVKGDGWSSSGTGVWVDCNSGLVPTVSRFQEPEGVMLSDPAQTHWRLADGPAVPEGRGVPAMSECLPYLPLYISRREDGSWHGADHPDGPWWPIPAPQSGLPWPTRATDGPAVLAESMEPASVTAEATEPLWVRAFMASDSTGTPRDAFAAKLRTIAAEVERRGDLGLDLDPGETADWLRAEADRAEADRAEGADG